MIGSLLTSGPIFDHNEIAKYRTTCIEGRNLRIETAAIAFLKQNDISHSAMEYPKSGPIAAKDVAAYFHFGDETDRLFKTLVTSDRKGGYYVFCLPAEKSWI